MSWTTPQKKRPLGGGATAPSPIGGGGGGGGAPAGGAAPAPSAGASPGYVNFSRILESNQAGAQRMANTLAQGVEQKGQQASQAISTTQQQVGDKVKAGTLQHTPSYNITRGPAMAGGAGGQNPYFQAGQMAGPNRLGYQGPKSWEEAGVDVGALEAQTREAGDAAQNLTTQGGRGAMLREQAGSGYSVGMSTLDSALAGAALGTRDDAIAARYGNLSQQLSDARDATDKQVERAISTSDAAGRGFQGEQAMWDRLRQPQPAAPAAPQAAPPPQGHPTDYMANPGASYTPGASPTTPPPSPYHRWVPGRGWVL